MLFRSLSVALLSVFFRGQGARQGAMIVMQTLAACKQETNYPAADTSTAVVVVPAESSTTTIVPVPGPTSTQVVGVPVPGPTVTETAKPEPTASPQ